MSIADVRRPDGGFDRPLEKLSACHLRIADQCTMLERLVAQVAAVGIEGNVRGAAAAVVHYFDTAAPNHHADEELDLFPALLESMAGSDAVCIRTLVASLEAEHRALDAHWGRLRPALVKIAAGEPADLSVADVQTFKTLYERHIDREETELLPMAARLIGDAELASIGRAMRARRGLGR